MTLNQAGRPATASGAPTAFWTLGGVTLKLSVVDAQGNQLVGPIDNIAAIGDLTNVSNALQTLLANPASSNIAGVGPVAGADLVANAVKSYDIFADVRAANTPSLASGQTLNIDVQGASAVGDGLGGEFYWSASSSAADDGKTVLKPTTAGATGRWLRLGVPLYQLVGLGVPSYVPKTIDQQVSSSTVLVNDTQLLATLAVGTWFVQVRLALLGTGGNSQGWKVQCNFSGTIAGPTAAGGINSVQQAAAASYMSIGNPLVNVTNISSTTGDVVTADFTLVVTTLGVFQVQFAQGTSSANPTIMKAGSLLIATRVA